VCVCVCVYAAVRMPCMLCSLCAVCMRCVPCVLWMLCVEDVLSARARAFG
jgi:hypothetical protein